MPEHGQPPGHERTREVTSEIGQGEDPCDEKQLRELFEQGECADRKRPFQERQAPDANPAQPPRNVQQKRESPHHGEVAELVEARHPVNAAEQARARLRAVEPGDEDPEHNDVNEQELSRRRHFRNPQKEINQTMSKEIWCTLGPASLSESVIARLEDVGVSLFRVNLSHTKLEDVSRIVRYIQSCTSVPVCLDTEGAQVRTGEIAGGAMNVEAHTTIVIPKERIAGDPLRFNLYPDYVVDGLVVGDLLRVDADVLVRVIAAEPGHVVVRVLNGGEIGNSKAVTVLERDPVMPPLTEKDRGAIAIGRELGIRHVALSFANRASDVDAIRAVAGEDAVVVSKIECLNGLANLPEIAGRSDALLIDRGDLSRQVNLERIPAVQKEIIRYAKDAGVPVYVATNLMESMVTAPTPTRAEVNDVFNTLIDGASGLVLAAESAVGRFPVGAAIMVRKIIHEYERTSRWGPAGRESTTLSPLVEPHGGVLALAPVRPHLTASTVSRITAEARPIVVDRDQIADCAQLACGAYSPLTGFLAAEDLASVLTTQRLTDGATWSLPVLLQLPQAELASVGSGDRIELVSKDCLARAVIRVRSVYELDLEKVATLWFGTNAREHPDVARLFERGPVAVAADVERVVNAEGLQADHELTPAQARLVFGQKGWTRVIAVPTWHVPQRGVERVHLEALESARADGLFLCPVVGATRRNDYYEDLLFKSYELLLSSGAYPVDKVVLGALAGRRGDGLGRETLFDAVRLQNLGCSHVLLPSRRRRRSDEATEPDETGSDLGALFARYTDVRIVPLFDDRPFDESPTTVTGSVTRWHAPAKHPVPAGA